MDGVLADFNKEYIKFDPLKDDRKKFRSAVLDHKIFERLDFLPDTQELLNHVSRLQGVTIEILTSMGTHDPVQGEAAKQQKLAWLNKHNLPYRANFVRNKQEKAQYANPRSILVDDSVGCISPFIEHGGHGILHVNSSDTISIIDAVLVQLRSIDA